MGYATKIAILYHREKVTVGSIGVPGCDTFFPDQIEYLCRVQEVAEVHTVFFPGVVSCGHLSSDMQPCFSLGLLHAKNMNRINILTQISTTWTLIHPPTIGAYPNKRIAWFPMFQRYNWGSRSYFVQLLRSAEYVYSHSWQTIAIEYWTKLSIQA